MIVHRQSVKAKPGCSRQAADLVVSEVMAQRERGMFTRPFRVYLPRLSGYPDRQLILEWEFEDLAEFDRVWADWFALPTTPTALEKWHELIEQGTATNEIWDVHTV